jgi:hypothetical protein
MRQANVRIGPRLRNVHRAYGAIPIPGLELRKIPMSGIGGGDCNAEQFPLGKPIDF